MTRVIRRLSCKCLAVLILILPAIRTATGDVLVSYSEKKVPAADLHYHRAHGHSTNDVLWTRTVAMDGVRFSWTIIVDKNTGQNVNKGWGDDLRVSTNLGGSQYGNPWYEFFMFGKNMPEIYIQEQGQRGVVDVVWKDSAGGETFGERIVKLDKQDNYILMEISRHPRLMGTPWCAGAAVQPGGFNYNPPAGTQRRVRTEMEDYEHKPDPAFKEFDVNKEWALLMYNRYFWEYSQIYVVVNPPEIAKARNTLTHFRLWPLTNSGAVHLILGHCQKKRYDESARLFFAQADKLLKQLQTFDWNIHAPSGSYFPAWEADVEKLLAHGRVKAMFGSEYEALKQTIQEQRQASSALPIRMQEWQRSARQLRCRQMQERMERYHDEIMLDELIQSVKQGT